jgi:hypothetical protein
MTDFSVPLPPGAVCVVVRVPDLYDDGVSEFETTLAYNLPEAMSPVNRTDLHRIALGMEAYLLALPGQFVKMGQAVQDNAAKAAQQALADQAQTLDMGYANDNKEIV